MFAFLKKLFTRKPKIFVNTNSNTIPGAFGYPEEKFSLLLKELTSFIDEDRLQSFKNFIEGPLFTKFELNMHKPEHAALLGYAFCAAVILQANLNTQTAINSVLKAFYPDQVPGPSLKKKPGSQVN